MKKLLFAVSALAALSLLAPSAGFAQYDNHMGIYTNTEDMAVNSTITMAQTQTVYFVITQPYNVEEDRPVGWINAYECSVLLEGTAFVTAIRWPVSAINVGSPENHVVGFGTGVQVVDGAAMVAEMDVFYGDATGGAVYLTLGLSDPVSLPGFMAYLDGDGTVNGGLVPMMTSAGDWALPVFAFNADPGIVATDNTSFDNIKAMYR